MTKPGDHKYKSESISTTMEGYTDDQVVLHENDKDNHSNLVHQVQSDVVEILGGEDHHDENNQEVYVGKSTTKSEADGLWGPETSKRLAELGYDPSKGLTKAQINEIHQKALDNRNPPKVEPAKVEPAKVEPTVVDQHVDASIAANGTKVDQVRPVPLADDKRVNVSERTDDAHGRTTFSEEIKNKQGAVEDFSLRTQTGHDGVVTARAEERITHTDGSVTDTEHKSRSGADGTIIKDKGHTTTTTADGDETRFAFKETTGPDGVKHVKIYQGRGFLGIGNGREIAEETIQQDGTATFGLTAVGQRRHFDPSLKASPQDLSATGATSVIPDAAANPNAALSDYVNKINTGMGVKSVTNTGVTAAPAKPKPQLLPTP